MIVEYFLKWIQTVPASERAAAAAALARAYISGDIAEDDRMAADSALMFLLDDPAVAVRRAMADVLSLSHTAPQSVIEALACDQPEISELVLARSPLLTDADLVERVRVGSGRVQKIIADRPVVSMAVSAALAEMGEADACLVLLENVGADVAEMSFRRVTERFGGVAKVREALIADHRLPAGCRHELLARLGETLRGSALVKAIFREEHAGRVFKDAWLKASVVLVDHTQPGEFIALAEHLRLRNELTPRFLIRALAHGKTEFFGAALVALTGYPHDRVRALVAGGYENALFALFNKAGLPQRMHGVICCALNIWREVARGKQVAGAQETSAAMLSRLGDDCADIAAVLKSVQLEEARAHARAHALSIRAA